jgi:hypothetical protein
MIRGGDDDGDDDDHDKKLRGPRHKCQGIINSFLTDPDINLRRLNVFNLIPFYS